MNDTTRTGSRIPSQTEHDHAWRLVRDARDRPHRAQFHVYACDLCAATWIT